MRRFSSKGTNFQYMINVFRESKVGQGDYSSKYFIVYLKVVRRVEL